MGRTLKSGWNKREFSYLKLDEIVYFLNIEYLKFCLEVSKPVC